MNQEQSIVSSSPARTPLLEKDHGYYHSSNLTLPVEDVYKFCQDQAYLQRVLSDLPDNVENFLDLKMKSAESIGNKQFKIVWENGDSAKVSGTLTFLLSESLGRSGTWLTAEANFSKLNFKTDGPSSLILIFLKRLKALIETGEVPTTKGQPSGREELKDLDKKTLH